MFKSLRHVWVCDGAVGVGKAALISSVPHAIASRHLEDVDSWRAFTSDHHPVLADYYNRVPGGVLNFNSLVVASQFSSQLNGLGTRPAAIFERTLLASSRVFASVLHDSGAIDDVSFAVINYNVETYARAQRLLLGDTPVTFIYLRASGSLCRERCAKRGRSEDADIPISIHDRICAKYDEFYERMGREGADVVQLDAALPLAQLSDMFISLLRTRPS